MWNADRFVKAISQAPDWIPEFTSKLESIPWKQNDIVLDYGCGQGISTKTYFLPPAIASNSKIYSVDKCSNMVEAAQKINADPHIVYRVGDLMTEGEFPYEDMRFDKIFCFYALHYIKDYRKLLQRFHKLVKSGGHVCILFTKDFAIFHLLQEIAKNPKWAKYMEGADVFLPEWIEKKQNILDEFRKSTEEIGFKVLELGTNESRNSVRMKLQTYIEICVALNPFLGKIPEEMYADLTADYEVCLRKLKPWDCEITDEITDFNVNVVFTILQKR